MSLRVAVIGGGLGGLACAARLSARGHRVTLYEAGASLGGKMNRFEHEGFRFDTGPSLITMPWIFEETFEAAGVSLRDCLEFKRLDPVAEYVWPDGTRFQHSTSLPHWLETLQRIEPRDVDGFLRFIELGARLFELSSETFLRRPITDPPDWRTLKALKHLPLRHGWGNYARTVAAHFKSPYLRQMFNRYPTYVGSSPYRCPATLAVIPYIEHAYGGWYVAGGLYRIVEALAEVAARNGAELLCQAPVQHIERHARRVKGVVLQDGRRISADVVIMNGDASALERMLGLREDYSLPEQQRSLSGFITLAAVKRDLPGLHHHTVCFSADYAREFKQLVDERSFPQDPTVYVNAPSRSDRSLVPGTGETLFIMANAPAGGAWNADDVAQARESVLRRLSQSGFPDVQDAMLAGDHWTPARIGATYHMPGGAIYGRNSHGWRNAFFRPANRQPTRGLYLVGGSSHPGGGTPTVLLSAKITTALIEKHESLG
jgi:phytoene desaturase